MSIANKLHSLILEAVVETQQQQIDAFIKEFASFDVKEEKKRLKHWMSRLEEMNRHAASEMFNESNKYTQSYFRLKRKIKEMQEKIERYDQNKDLIDTFARTHKDYVLRKHGKVV